MKRYRQALNELLKELSPVQTGWLDEHAEAVIGRLKQLKRKRDYIRADLVDLLQPEDLATTATRGHFEAGLTVVRLFLDLSKDEFVAALKERLGSGIGITRAKRDPGAFYGALEDLGVLAKMAVTLDEVSGGRLIKGQRRGRFLEDFVERLLIQIFGEGTYDSRCQFVGATGMSKEKTDFAIPSKKDPAILIEAKAYGATGSKQTDVLGDITRIVNEKRGDTHFLLVTDGVTWRERVNDLRRLIELQNHGKITRIYTQSMADRLESDLKQLKQEHGL